jgi:hypothetical protein
MAACCAYNISVGGKDLNAVDCGKVSVIRDYLDNAVVLHDFKDKDVWYPQGTHPPVAERQPQYQLLGPGWCS